MVKVFFQREKSQSAEKKETIPIAKESDPNRYIFLVYVQWSQDNRVIKTYMRTKKLTSERDMICNGLSDLVANPDMRLNSKNIKMAILYQFNDDHDISKNFDVTGIIPTRLDHYLNSDPGKRIDFSQEQIDDIVNKVEFTYRAIK
ncbi:MAG: hypothetical protein KAJ62_12500 [Desulfobacteraceae bacterium]|nr:hypothetical protein [Desulfobacteraceae bacterium]